MDFLDPPPKLEAFGEACFLLRTNLNLWSCCVGIDVSVAASILNLQSTGRVSEGGMLQDRNPESFFPLSMYSLFLFRDVGNGMRQKSLFYSLLARQQTNKGKEEIERRNSSGPRQSADEREWRVDFLAWHSQKSWEEDNWMSWYTGTYNASFLWTKKLPKKINK